VQAICDAHCRFSYVSVQTPGTTHDSLAFSLCDAYDLLTKSALSATLARLEYYIVVDQAYAVTHTMMGPWPGDNLDANKDTFNYYQSRTRITIERSFGILTKRFLVLKRPYGGKLKNVALLVEVCMKLHNLVIDAGELDLAVHSSDVTGQPDNAAGLDTSRTPVAFDNSHLSSHDPQGSSVPLDDAQARSRPNDALDPNGPACFDCDESPRDSVLTAQRGQGARQDVFCNARTFITNNTVPDNGLYRPDPGMCCKWRRAQ